MVGTLLTHPGVYYLGPNEMSWGAEQLWKTYTMLTDLEAIFRSLKSELGLRPTLSANAVVQTELLQCLDFPVWKKHQD